MDPTAPPENPDSVATRRRAEPRTGETSVEAIVTAVADVTEQSPLEMDPLGEVVDNDALNALVDGQGDRSSPPSVTFDYCGQRVTVTPDAVEIAPANGSE